ncbi:hypothetical protein CDAR_480441 [Caerostris darwini]|uniref:Uncharacterized protein n=1 Tax=Caerostris darwini TaxID=1538125 RepID=A0AAV4V0Z9_9ARAC|nr:hypothetical protein CDAR_480441 [Caerostris darwini]
MIQQDEGKHQTPQSAVLLPERIAADKLHSRLESGQKTYYGRRDGGNLFYNSSNYLTHLRPPSIGSSADNGADEQNMSFGCMNGYYFACLHLQLSFVSKRNWLLP